MAARFGLSLTMTMLLAGSAAAQSVIVQDNFDQYADRAAFLAQWVPTSGNGNTALDPSDQNYTAGLLTDDLEFPSSIPDVQGKAVDHVGAAASTNMVNQYGGIEEAFTLNPTDEENIFLKADIYVGPSGNERMSVGLRNRAPANLLEMGVYNAATRDPRIEGPLPPTPTDPNYLPSLGYGYRLALWGERAEDLIVEPDWQYFVLPAELDRETDTDELVTIGDVGAGWHTYTALVTPTTVTLTIDLFRDGLRNTSITPDEGTGIRPGTPGVDAEVTWEISATAAGFNSLRLGGPSGLSSAGAGAMGFDNILLQTQAGAVPTDNADFNGDNIVDGADFLIWQRGFGTGTNLATGDADGNGVVNDLDLGIWKTQFGTDPTPSAAAVGAIPEPTTLALAGLAMAAGLAASRRR
jgi:hypothetical protein